jgi:hypothetical protein
MIGFPTESYKEASDTIAFAARSPLHRAFFFNPTPFEGTELADMILDSQKKGHDNILLHNVNYYHSTLNISAMSDYELQRVFRFAYRRFYLNPKRILRLVINHPKNFSLPWYAILALIKILPKSRNID